MLKLLEIDQILYFLDHVKISWFNYLTPEIYYIF